MSSGETHGQLELDHHVIDTQLYAGDIISTTTCETNCKQM